MNKTIAVLPGDGVGPEITHQAVQVLQKGASIWGHTFTIEYGDMGAAAIEKTGHPFPKETYQLCTKADAVLFGAAGDPKYDNDPTATVRPEQGILQMRKDLGLYANIRPIFTIPQLLDKSPLKEKIIHNTDFVVIRELTGGIYFGEKGRLQANELAYDTCTYTRKEITRVSTIAFERAQTRRKKLTIVDKANVMETSRLWRETTQHMANTYPDVQVEYMFVDNAAMQIVKRPSHFDVILTENMFGDILTDEASVITGSIGMLPSASLGEKTAVYEPIHGSYPKAAGTNTANPIGTILSTALMLEYSFGLKKESEDLFQAVKKTLASGRGTKDIVSQKPSSTSEIGDIICSYLK